MPLKKLSVVLGTAKVARGQQRRVSGSGGRPLRKIHVGNWGKTRGVGVALASDWGSGKKKGKR